jgi:hypothetical protein
MSTRCVLLFLACGVAMTACATAAPNARPEEVVTLVLRELAKPSVLPPLESNIRSLFRSIESGGLEVITQPQGHDLKWTSANERCFVVFAIDDQWASSIWGSCLQVSEAAAITQLQSWVDALPPLDSTSLPSSANNFTRTHVRGSDTAIDLSMQRSSDRKWLIGFGIRTGVPP